jgi:hypothetical protein
LLIRVQVTGTGLALFLQTQVIGRKYKRRGRVGKLEKAGKRADELEVLGEAEDEEPTVGHTVIRYAINAITHLWARQQSVSNGTVPNPRGNYDVKKIINTLSRNEATRKRGVDVDRVKGESGFEPLPDRDLGLQRLQRMEGWEFGTLVEPLEMVRERR